VARNLSNPTDLSVILSQYVKEHVERAKQASKLGGLQLLRLGIVSFAKVINKNEIPAKKYARIRYIPQMRA
jgi:hypothetical protein